MNSFIPIAKLGGGPYSFVVHPSIPANSVKEFIVLAKQKPGQLIFAASGVAAPPHMSAELFKIMTNIDCKILQFKGAGPALISLLGGHSHAMIGTTTPVLSHIKSGKLKVLGTGGATRSVALPDVPTIAEAGVPGYEAVGWQGLLARSGTPKSVVSKLNGVLTAYLKRAEATDRMRAIGMDVKFGTPEEFNEFIRSEVQKWKKIIVDAGITAE